MNSRDQLNDPCAGVLHRITAAGAVAPYRWRCVVCERQFLTAPNSIRVDRPPPVDGETVHTIELPELCEEKPAAAPALEPRFVAVKSAVMSGGEHIATAISKTMAKRIANALNKHKPNREGV